MASVAKIKPATGSIHWLKEHIAEGVIRPHAEITILTPALAAEILRHNPGNRGVTQVKLRHYVSAMRRGLWPLNGETIILSKEGLLNDGQTRCLAVVESNTPIPATIFFGAERSTRSTVDMGSARTAGHLLTMDGLSNSTHRGAIARYLLAYEESDGRSVAQANSFSSFDNYQRAKNDEEIGIVASFTGSNGKLLKPVAQPAIVGAAYYIFRMINEDDADEYINQIVKGENIATGDPAFTVRQRLLAMAKNPQGKFEIILRGWNYYRKGRKLKAVKVEGVLPELN